MEHHKMPQDILVAEYHGTFHDTPSNKLHQIFPEPSKKVGFKREGTKKMESSI
jgi:hypothetical protein